MTEFAKRVVNKLLDKYEKSVLSKSGSQRSLKIIIKNTHTEPLFKQYNNPTFGVANQQLIEASLTTLEQRNIIAVKKHNQFIKDIELNLSMLPAAYAYVNRTSKIELEQEILIFLREEIAQSTNNIVKKFANKLIHNINKHFSNLSYYKNIYELKRTFKGIKVLINNEEPMLLRTFSEMAFSDSKFFEKQQSFFLRIFQEFSDEQKFNSFEELCATYNIFKNPAYLYIKNGITYKVNNQIINLEDYGIEMAVSVNAISIMEIISINVKRVITIENLTSFHQYNDKDSLIIYTGGFAGGEVVSFIKKLKSENNSLAFYHFGDIDVNGFRIIHDLEEKSNTRFKPLFMDFATLKRYKKYGMPLSENDIKGLKGLQDDHYYEEFNEVITYMLMNNIKLEQEVVDTKEGIFFE